MAVYTFSDNLSDLELIVIQYTKVQLRHGFIH